jgi:hypothetical protein
MSIGSEPKHLAQLRRSLALLHAQATAGGCDEAADRLDEALAAIGAPVSAPPPIRRDHQFPAPLFHDAIARLEQAAGTRLADRDSLLDCWLALRAARAAWQATPHERRGSPG